MPFLRNFQGGQSPGFTPQAFPQGGGLMANPSSMQFMQAMMQQPGGQFGAGNIPDYGTGMNFGVPMFNQQQTPFRNIRPPVVAAPPSTSGGAAPYEEPVVGRQGSER